MNGAGVMMRCDGHPPGVNAGPKRSLRQGLRAVAKSTVDEIRARFDAANVGGADRVITYCGGGIAASSAALALTLLGHEDVAVYDASLAEWAMDESLPMEAGA